MNQITHHLDGSNIYGSSRAEEDELRAHSGGLMKVDKGLLPEDLSTMLCSVNELPCFMAGELGNPEMRDGGLCKGINDKEPKLILRLSLISDCKRSMK